MTRTEVLLTLCIWFLCFTDAEKSNERSRGSLNRFVQQADREDKADGETYGWSQTAIDNKVKVRKRRNVMAATSEMSANKQLQVRSVLCWLNLVNLHFLSRLKKSVVLKHQ